MSKPKDFRGLCERSGKAYRIDPRLLEAVIWQESAGNPKSFRYEPAHMDGSFGLMQVMGNTARAMGLPASERDASLCDPERGVTYGTRVLRDNLDRVSAATAMARSRGEYERLSVPLPKEIQIMLAVYNGGPKSNPNPDGVLRNQKYVDEVTAHFKSVCQEVG